MFLNYQGRLAIYYAPWNAAAGLVEAGAAVLALVSDVALFVDHRALRVDRPCKVTVPTLVAHPAVQTLALDEAVDDDALDVAVTVVLRRARLILWRHLRRRRRCRREVRHLAVDAEVACQCTPQSLTLKKTTGSW